MSEAAVRYETDRPTQHCFRTAAESRGASAGHGAPTLREAPYDRSAMSMESCAPELRTLAVTNDRADDGIPGRLLVIGDGRALMRDQLRRAFPAPAHRIQFASTAYAGIEHVSNDSPDVLILDLALPDESGLEVYQQIRRMNVHLPVIVVAEASQANVAIEVIKNGAYEILFKPLELSLLRRVVGEALDVAQRMRQPPAPEEIGMDPDVDVGIVGCCPAMGDVYKAIGRVAGQTFPVLITGESGTGKELVARAIHQHGPRAKGPFLALNCAAIPETLLESELFGHEKGAFTGADRRRTGKFEQCNGGSLFLDELGDMPLALQAKALRLLQEQTFERVGGNETIRTDVRLIAATQRDLKAWSADGKFRPDLYYRLGVFTIELPPLRDRGDDLPLLVRHYVRRFSRELGRQVSHVSPDALERLRNYSWPGNIRELQSVLKQALLRASGTVLLPAFLPEPLGGFSEEPGAETFILHQRIEPNVRDLYRETHRQIDRLLLARVLARTRGNIRRAALLLGISRQTLRVKLRDLSSPASVVVLKTWPGLGRATPLLPS